jgi:hypothetical protein
MFGGIVTEDLEWNLELRYSMISCSRAFAALPIGDLFRAYSTTL